MPKLTLVMTKRITVWRLTKVKHEERGVLNQKEGEEMVIQKDKKEGKKEGGKRERL
jgi:hypothetical protein